jgi:hypothetical protein
MISDLVINVGLMFTQDYQGVLQLLYRILTLFYGTFTAALFIYF